LIENTIECMCVCKCPVLSMQGRLDYTLLAHLGGCVCRCLRRKNNVVWRWGHGA